MKKNPSNDILSQNVVGVGAASRKTLRERAVELAMINGHSAQDVSKADWEQAKRELRGDADSVPTEGPTEAAPLTPPRDAAP